jgi:hypothetical protein
VGGFANRVFLTILRGNKNPAAIITALETLTICKQTVFVIPKSISSRSIARHLFVFSDCRNLENPPLAIAVHSYLVSAFEMYMYIHILKLDTHALDLFNSPRP